MQVISSQQGLVTGPKSPQLQIFTREESWRCLQGESRHFYRGQIGTSTGEISLCTKCTISGHIETWRLLSNNPHSTIELQALGRITRYPERLPHSAFRFEERRDNSRMVADSETIPAPRVSSSDLGGHLALESATRPNGTRPFGRYRAQWRPRCSESGKISSE
jgi:hypothetical protein